jgi:hypothetical protein
MLEDPKTERAAVPQHAVHEQVPLMRSQERPGRGT